VSFHRRSNVPKIALFFSLEEIHHVRMGNVCQLLTETRSPLHEIARRGQFKHANYLSRRFKRPFVLTLSRFREKASPA